ncbi:MAG: 30S ribosome-binding factor RbfA [Pseudomonadales bacterium]
MPREFSRGRKVADLIQRELALLIQREVKDPRIGMVTINEATVSKDLSWSDVYFTVLGTDDFKGVEETLNQASGFLRSQLAKSLDTRTIPKLRFHYDQTTSTAAQLDKAIAAARAMDSKGPALERDS